MELPGFKMTEDDKKKVVDKLNERGVHPVCPMCGNKNFSLAEGYFNNILQGSIQSALVLGGPSVPTIAIICTNCGFTSQHALGALGLLQYKEGGK